MLNYVSKSKEELSLERVAIFGDSSADPNVEFNHSWVELLAQKFSVDNFAKQGSSLLYSYEKLLEQGKNYKKIIIFIAPVGRMYVPNCKLSQHFINQKTVEIHKGTADFYQGKILDAIEQYFNYLWVFEKECLVQQAIVDSIKVNFPNALLIPVTKDSIRNFTGLCMHDISFLDYEYYEVHEYTPDLGRTCHMNKENNKIFARIIENWIETENFKIDIDMFKYPVESKKELFYDKKY